MALKPATKLKLLEALDLFKAIGIATLLILAIQTQHTQSQQTKFTKDQVVATKAVVDQIKQETNDLMADNHSDHDQLLTSINCMAELFGEHPGEFIPKSEFDACLNGTRIAPQLQSTQSSSPAQTNENQNQPQQTANNPESSNTNDNKNGQGNQPKFPFICTLTLKLIGC